MASTPSTIVDPEAAAIDSLSKRLDQMDSFSKRLDRMMRRMEETLARMDGAPAPIVPAVVAPGGSHGECVLAPVVAGPPVTSSPTAAAATTVDVVPTTTSSPPPPLTAMAIGATTGNVKRIVAAFEFARVQREMERRRERMELFTSVVSATSTATSSASLSSPASSTTPAAKTSVAPTSIDISTLSFATTSEPHQAPPARCSTWGHNHGDRSSHVPVSAASISSHDSTAPSAAPTHTGTVAFVLCTDEEVPDESTTKCLTHCLSGKFRYFTMSIPTYQLEVMLPCLASKMYDTQTIFERVIDQYPVVLWPTCISCWDFVLGKGPWPPPHMDELDRKQWPPPIQLEILVSGVILRPIPWPSFSGHIGTISFMNPQISYDGHMVFDRGKCITHGLCMLLTVSWIPTIQFVLLSDGSLLRQTSLGPCCCSVTLCKKLLNGVISELLMPSCSNGTQIVTVVEIMYYLLSLSITRSWDPGACVSFCTVQYKDGFVQQCFQHALEELLLNGVFCSHMKLMSSLLSGKILGWVYEIMPTCCGECLQHYLISGTAEQVEGIKWKSVGLSQFSVGPSVYLLLVRSTWMLWAIFWQYSPLLFCCRHGLPVIPDFNILWQFYTSDTTLLLFSENSAQSMVFSGNSERHHESVGIQNLHIVPIRAHSSHMVLLALSEYMTYEGAFNGSDITNSDNIIHMILWLYKPCLKTMVFAGDFHGMPTILLHYITVVLQICCSSVLQMRHLLLQQVKWHCISIIVGDIMLMQLKHNSFADLCGLILTVGVQIKLLSDVERAIQIIVGLSNCSPVAWLCSFWYFNTARRTILLPMQVAGIFMQMVTFVHCLFWCCHKGVLVESNVQILIGIQDQASGCISGLLLQIFSGLCCYQLGCRKRLESTVLLLQINYTCYNLNSLLETHGTQMLSSFSLHGLNVCKLMAWTRERAIISLGFMKKCWLEFCLNHIVLAALSIGVQAPWDPGGSVHQPNSSGSVYQFGRYYKKWDHDDFKSGLGASRISSGGECHGLGRHVGLVGQEIKKASVSIQKEGATEGTASKNRTDSLVFLLCPGTIA